MVGPEAKIETYLKEAVEAAGGQCYKVTGSIRGIPDRIVILNGLTVFVELKAPKKGKLSAHQENRFREITKSGGFVFLVSEKQTVDELILFLLQDIDECPIISPHTGRPLDS